MSCICCTNFSSSSLFCFDNYGPFGGLDIAGTAVPVKKQVDDSKKMRRLKNKCGTWTCIPG